MRKLWKRVISIILASILSIPTVNIAWAKEIPDIQVEFLEDSLYIQSINAMNQEEIDLAMEDIYKGLSEEARIILEEYMYEQDQEMLNYYEKMTGRTVNEHTIQMKNMTLNEEEAENRSAAVTGMQALGGSLKALGLETAVYNALMAVGAEFAALTVITLTAVISILAIASLCEILYNNWGKTKGKWGSITSAFVNAFATSTSSKGAINDGFARKKEEQDQIVNDYKKGESALRTGTYDTNAGKHIDTEFITRIRQNKTPSEVYYSSKRRVLLFVFNIPSGYKANLNKSLAKNGGEYDLVDYNVSGFTMYVLVNPVKGKIFHCHMRKSKNDLIQFRNANQLDWRFKPTPVKFESKYTNATGSGTFLGNQTD